MRGDINQLLCKIVILSYSGMLHSVGWFRTDVSGVRTGPIVKGQAWTSSPLKMGPIGSPETSVKNQPSLRNIPENDRIQVDYYQPWKCYSKTPL